MEMNTTYQTPAPWGHKVTVEPTVEPCTAADVRALMRIDDSIEDVLITSMIKAARRQVEKITGRKLITQTVTVICDEFPAGDWELPFPPVSAVTIAYRDSSGTTQAFTSFTTRNASQPNLPAILQPTSGWPSTDGYSGCVTATLTCGYGAAASALPDGLVHAVKLLAGHYFENRNVIVMAGAFQKIPMHLDALVDEYRWRFNS